MFCFFVFCLLRAIPVAYGSSQARGLLKLQLPAYTTATVTPDPSHVCDPHHSSRQHQLLNPLNEARDSICNIMVPSQIHFQCATTGTPTITICKSNNWVCWFFSAWLSVCHLWLKDFLGNRIARDGLCEQAEGFLIPVSSVT